jgi:hypothetical protein
LTIQVESGFSAKAKTGKRKNRKRSFFIIQRCEIINSKVREISRSYIEVC